MVLRARLSVFWFKAKTFPLFELERGGLEHKEHVILEKGERHGMNEVLQKETLVKSLKCHHPSCEVSSIGSTFITIKEPIITDGHFKV